MGIMEMLIYLGYFVLCIIALFILIDLHLNRMSDIDIKFHNMITFYILLIILSSLLFYIPYKMAGLNASIARILSFYLFLSLVCLPLPLKFYLEKGDSSDG